MKILSLIVGHDSSACVIKDGNILFFMEEEKLTYLKKDDLPTNLMQEVKKYVDDEVDVDYDFNGVVNGQTLTLYVKNPEGTEMTPTFINTDQVPVIWGAEYGNTAPAIAANKTNLYTFVRINTGIFASAVTGYVY